MKWDLTEQKFGDMIRVKVGPLFHYGIYVNDNEIIQFGVNPALRQGKTENEIEVCITDIETFLCNEFLEVAIPQGKEKRTKNSPEKAVELARSRLGEKGYHLLYNNCEHFAYECVTGVKYCSQTENVRNMFKNLAVTDVYFASIVNSEISELYPKERWEQIEVTNDKNLKIQRYFVWKLLEYALNRSFGYKLQNLSFTKSESGKWSCKECYFSLSHSNDAVCVAVSRKPVGVDIEPQMKEFNDKISKKILNENEFDEFNRLNDNEKAEYLTRKWCAKESIFKQGNESVFSPSTINTESNVICNTIEIASKLYHYAVSSPDTDKLRIYNNIKL